MTIEALETTTNEEEQGEGRRREDKVREGRETGGRNDRESWWYLQIPLQCISWYYVPLLHEHQVQYNEYSVSE